MHMFHETCVAELQRLGMQQLCPLCRSPLSPELEFYFMEIAHRYIAVQRMVERGDMTWSALPTWAQNEMAKVVAELRAVASKDFMHAYQFLGWLYESGRGVAQSHEEAARWYTKAAEKGSAQAQCKLGSMFDEGYGVEQSDTMAAHWIRRSAEQGYPRAQCYLGRLFELGRGVAQNDEEAVQWWQKSAAQGFAEAQSFMGVAFELGIGVDQSVAEARRWYTKAADQGVDSALVRMSVVLGSGRGAIRSNAKEARGSSRAAEQEAEGPRDLTEGDREAAVHSLRKAADQGRAGAQYSLGVMFL